jgi:hypothetical protein
MKTTHVIPMDATDEAMHVILVNPLDGCVMQGPVTQAQLRVYLEQPLQFPHRCFRQIVRCGDWLLDEHHEGGAWGDQEAIPGVTM